jgi:DNA-binding NtrC family response regulator
MTQTDSPHPTILVAIPDEWREVLAQFLKREGFSVLLVTSLDEASSIIHSQSLSAVVMISDWAIASDEGKTDGLMKIVKGKIPIVSLITPRTWRDARSRWFDELCHPPLHEYCSIPADTEQLSRHLSKAIEEAVNI